MVTPMLGLVALVSGIAAAQTATDQTTAASGISPAGEAKSSAAGATPEATAASTSNAVSNPATAANPGVHRHDGFYLRFAIGAGFVQDWGKHDSGISYDLRGLTVPFELWAGGTVSSGLVVGLGLSISPLSAPKSDPELVTEGKGFSAQYTRVGPFVDFYPDPEQGLHVLGSVNMGGMLVKDVASGKAMGNNKGVALTAGVGYGLWIASEWSVGVIGQFGYTYAWAQQESH